jgi:arylsulfatase A-like enzyme
MNATVTSIALVVLDTLRKDAFDDQFGWLPGTNFEQAYANSHYTVPSHSSLFTGLYPSETGTHAKSHVFDPPHPSLAHTLQKSGYQTAAFSANVQISRQFGWDQGFDDFNGSWKSKHANSRSDIFEWNAFIRKHRDEGPERYLRALWECVWSDCDTIPSLKHGFEIKYRTHTAQDDGATEALDYVSSNDFSGDSFLFINLMEAHGPYRPPESYRSVELDDMPGFAESVESSPLPENEANTVRQAYSDSVKYLSEMYQKIFAELREEFDVTVTLADHGEMLGEDGFWGHGLGLYPELTHIPLSIWGIDGPEVRTEIVSLLDVHRTILALAGVDDTAYKGRGRDLREAPEPAPQLTEYLGLNMWRERKLAASKSDEYDIYDQQLYGIAIEEDYYGYETFDGFEESGSSQTDSPRTYMEEFVSELEYRSGGEEAQVSDAVMQSLEDLGYA